MSSERYCHHYLQRLYPVRGEDPDLYDLIINTERMTPEGAANLSHDTLSTRLEAAPANASGEQVPRIF